MTAPEPGSFTSAPGRLAALAELIAPPWTACTVCAIYSEHRGPDLVDAIAAQAAVSGEPPPVIIGRLMRGVHRRHLRGLPILPAAQP